MSIITELQAVFVSEIRIYLNEPGASVQAGKEEERL